MKKGLKIVLIVVSSFFGLILLIGIIGGAMLSGSEVKASKKEANGVMQAAVVESSAKEQKVNAAEMKSLMQRVTVKKDEFDGTAWVEPKDKPRYRNNNGMYLYFAQEADSTASNLRFVFQYAAEDWLFIHTLKFLIDGQPYEYVPNKVDTDNDQSIWEWSDELITPANVQIIEALANAKTAKVRFVGRQYSKEKNITAQQIASIKNMLALYRAKGGSI